MSLKNLKTDLKSLKYGKDQPGGGNSGQPYIQTDINSSKNFLGFDDGLIRGGAVGAARASVNDTIRIGKFLKDFSKGPLWIVRQVGLQRSNPKLETLAGVGGLLGEPTRIYNAGVNTLLQVPVAAFGVHFNRHGLLPIQPDSTKYLNIVQKNDANYGANNRLVKLKKKLGIGNTLVLNKAAAFTLATLGENIADIVFNKIIPSTPIDSYSGGPGSVYGIGRTLIKRYEFTGNKEQSRIPILDTTVNNSGENLKTNYKYATPISTAYGASSTSRIDKTVIPYPENIPAGWSGTSNSPTKRKYDDLKKAVDDSTINKKDKIFTDASLPPWVGIGGSNADAYTSDKISYNNGSSTITLSGTWATFNREQRIGSGKQDRINTTDILKNVNSIYTADDGGNIRDLVSLRIFALHDDNPEKADLMAFRAYITQFSDSVDAKWNATNYLGRGEEFYIYGGFTRKIQVGFKVATLSSKEMEPTYKKLNYLMGNLMPIYPNGLMRGPMVKMTVGNWINNQDGVLNSLSYTVPNDSPWEIAIDEPEGGSSTKLLVLPHIVEVSLTFTPIGSQTKGVNKVSQKSFDTSHIAQNVNDYQYIK